MYFFDMIFLSRKGRNTLKLEKDSAKPRYRITELGLG